MKYLLKKKNGVRLRMCYQLLFLYTKIYTIQTSRNVLDTFEIVLMNKIRRLNNENIVKSEDHKNKEEE